jgi:hypothetical protein
MSSMDSFDSDLDGGAEDGEGGEYIDGGNTISSSPNALSSNNAKKANKAKGSAGGLLATKVSPYYESSQLAVKKHQQDQRKLDRIINPPEEVEDPDNNAVSKRLRKPPKPPKKANNGDNKANLKVKKTPKEIDDETMARAKNKFLVANLGLGIREGLNTDSTQYAPALIPIPKAFEAPRQKIPTNWSKKQSNTSDNNKKKGGGSRRRGEEEEEDDGDEDEIAAMFERNIANQTLRSYAADNMMYKIRTNMIDGLMG